MKRIYWRPPGVSRTALLLIAVVALLGLAAVESFPMLREEPYHREKLAAAQLAKDSMAAIKAEKERLGIPINPEVDPYKIGMIGESLTPVTSNTGYLNAKRTATNPNFAAVIVDFLKAAGVQAGDVVTVAVSGSFPSLNVATFAALQVLGATPVVITSLSSSEWGANHVNYLWLDMERTLHDRQLVGFRSVAASLGGIDDRGVGISKAGVALLQAAIERHGLTPLDPKSLTDSIEQRMRIYADSAAGKPVKAYINVGGGSASVGTHVGKKLFRPGLNTSVPPGAGVVDSVMLRYAMQDVPVIHVSRIELIAKRYGLPIEPLQPPPVGQGKVYVSQAYNPWIAVGALAAIFLALLGFIRLDFGVRILRGGRPEKSTQHAEPMV